MRTKVLILMVLCLFVGFFLGVYFVSRSRLNSSPSVDRTSTKIPEKDQSVTESNIKEDEPTTEDWFRKYGQESHPKKSLEKDESVIEPKINVPELEPFNSGGFKPGSEPDGFRGIKWGTSLSSLSGMQYYKTDPSYGGMSVYLSKGDELLIGAAKLDRIEYNFWKGKFCSVKILTKGFENWEGLKQAVFEKIGKGFQLNRYLYSYAGKQTEMLMSYVETTKSGGVWLSSKTLNDEMEAEEEQKAKEGAKKGF